MIGMAVEIDERSKREIYVSANERLQSERVTRHKRYKGSEIYGIDADAVSKNSRKQTSLI